MIEQAQKQTSEEQATKSPDWPYAQHAPIQEGNQQYAQSYGRVWVETFE